MILFNLFDVMLFDDLTISRCVTVAFDDYFFCFFLIFCGSGCWVSFFYFFLCSRWWGSSGVSMIIEYCCFFGTYGKSDSARPGGFWT